MSLQEYQAFKDVLYSRIVKLEGLVHVVESYKLLLEEKTKGYVAAITTQRPPYPHSWFYIVRWFRTFVGIKDEAMLLINGELVRKYHKQQHEAHIHTRGKEDKYYKVPGLLGLSGCSCDGLNYDLRLISKQYKEYATKRKEEEILNRLSDRVYEAEDRLDGFCKTIDKMVDVFRTELRKKAASHIRSVVIEYKYKAEHLAVKFDPSATSCTDASYTCQEARRGSRMHALHSGIEEPPTISIGGAPSDSTAIRPTTTTSTSTATYTDPAVSRPPKTRRLLIEDDDDISYQQEVARKRAEAAAEAARLAALEAQKAPDFGFHYSIDAEKREFGAAVELLALPTERDLHRDDDEDATDIAPNGDPISSGGAIAAGNGSSSPEWTLRPRTLSSEELTLRDQSTLKLKIHFPGHTTASGSDASLVRARVEGTEIATFSSVAPSAVIPQLSHAHLSVSLVHCKTIAELGLPASSTMPAMVVKVAVDEVVQEVWRQLWLGGILGQTDLLVLPVGVRVGSEEFRIGDYLESSYTGAWMPLPTAEDLLRKRYQVLCEGRTHALRLLQLVATTMLEPSTQALTIDRKVGFGEFILAQRSLLVRLCHAVCAHEDGTARRTEGSTEDGSVGVDLRDTALATVSDDDADHVEALLNLVKSCIGPGRHLNTDISGNQQWTDLFAVLLRASTELRAQASGITFLDLLNCVAPAPSTDDTLQHPALEPSPTLLELRRLDLSYNPFLSYVDAPWELLTLPPGLLSSLPHAAVRIATDCTESHSEPMDLDIVDLTLPQLPRHSSTDGEADPVAAFLTWLLCCSPSLLVLDLSQCATTAAQAEVLCKALQSAVTARAHRGLPAVKDILVHGLHQLHPVRVAELIQSVSSQSHSQGTTRFDAGGGCFVI